MKHIAEIGFGIAIQAMVFDIVIRDPPFRIHGGFGPIICPPR